MTNYILNVRILNCEKLTYKGHPADDCKFFIRCHLQNYNNSYCQTKSIENNSNPQFNEELKFCVYDPKRDKLVVEVIRQDSDQEINLCSPAIFPLNKIKIGLMSFEKTSVPLFDNDQPVGTLNIAGQIFSEDTPQIINSFTSPVLLRINILQVPNIQKQETDNGNNDIYLTFLLQGHDESEKIECHFNKKTLNPSWNQSLSIISNDPINDVLQIKMTSGDQDMFDKTVKVSEIELNNTNHINLSFGEDIVAGPLLINVSINNLNIISKNIAKVHVKILKGTDLMKMKFFGKSNPYVKVSLGDKEAFTDVQNSTLNPEWNQEFDFLTSDPINDNLILQVFHQNPKSSDDEMMDPICIPIKDLNLTSFEQPGIYDVPVFYQQKEAGHLSFEIYTECENLIVPKKSISKYIVEFTLLEANFIDSKNVSIRYALRSKEGNEFQDVEINKPVKLNIKDLQNESIVYVFEDSKTHEELCDPFIVNLKLFTVNEASEINAEAYHGDDKNGNVKIIISIKEIQKKKQESQDQSDDKNEVAGVVVNNDEFDKLKRENEKLKEQVSSSIELVSSLQAEIQKLKEANSNSAKE